ncbi:MAG TPA: hypothetical protein PK006_11665 [Saprospiraceae bacterium]|nr:hypothetical protein [Saprospiraceae bacterium]
MKTLLILVFLSLSNLFWLPNGFGQQNYFNPNRGSLFYQKGHGDARIFSNYFREFRGLVGGDVDQVFWSVYPEFMYGLNEHFNIGARLKLRSVVKASQLSFLEPLNQKSTQFLDYRKTALSSLQIVLRHSIGTKWTAQHAVGIATGKNLSQNGFVDWDGFTWQTQFFNDLHIGSWRLFSDIGFLSENINSDLFSNEKSHYFQNSFPINFLPGILFLQRHYIYSLINYTPQWIIKRKIRINGDTYIDHDFSSYFQLGIAYKYFYRSWEFEGLLTLFKVLDDNQFAHTSNFGIRKYF